MVFNAYFEEWGIAVGGVPRDYMKLVACLVASVVLSPVLPTLKSARSRHLMNIAVSVVFMVGILDLWLGTLQLVLLCLAVYGMVKYRVGGPQRMPWVVFAVAMTHMTITHLIRQFGGIPLTTIEISAMQMVLTMNLTTFAWDCYDGQLRSEAECDATQKQSRIVEMPSLLEYFGYCFYFPGVLVGPSTRFQDYLHWARGEFYASPGSLPEMMATPPPGRFPAAMSQIAFAFVVLAVQARFQERLSYERLSDPADAMQSHSPVLRILFLQAAGLNARVRYYAVWSLSNAACIGSGLGFSGWDQTKGIASWNRGRNVDMLAFEFASNFKEMLDAWNINTSVWLRNNVYKRVTPPGRRPGFRSLIVTFLVSAFWHGVAPGYYFTFLLGGFFQYLGRLLRKSVRPIFFENPRRPDPTLDTFRQYTRAQIAYSIVCKVCSQMAINYSAMSFLLLNVGPSIQAYRSVYWYGHIALVVSLAAFHLGLPRLLRPLRAAPPAESKAKTT